MDEIRIPDWWFGLRPEHRRAIYTLFQAVLRDLPMSHSALAHKVGVNQSTVSRWASGQTQPSLEHMVAAVEAVGERLAQLHERVDRTGRALHAVEAVREAVRRHDLAGAATAAGKVGKVLDEDSQEDVHEE